MRVHCPSLVPCRATRSGSWTDEAGEAANYCACALMQAATRVLLGVDQRPFQGWDGHRYLTTQAAGAEWMALTKLWAAQAGRVTAGSWDRDTDHDSHVQEQQDGAA